MDPEGTQLFTPEMPVVPEHGFDVVLINRRITVTDHTDISSCFIVTAYPLLVRKCDLGVRDHGRKKKCMGGPALRAFHPTDTEPDRSGRQLYCPPVVAMDREAGRMATGTGQLMERKIKNNRIIKGLRNLVAIPGKNGYHSIVNRHRVTCG